MTDETRARRDTNELYKNSNDQKCFDFNDALDTKTEKASSPRMIVLMSIHRRGQLLDTFPNEPLSSARFPLPRILLEGKSGPTNSICRIEKSFGESQSTPQPAELAALGGSDKSPGGLAQLGERLHGMQKVRGSSPLSSILSPNAIG